MFAGFSAGQQYLTVLLERTGHGQIALVSLFLLYGTFLLASTVIARIIHFFCGVKRTLSAGACIYALFIASVAFENVYLLLFSSVVMGIGAAMLWVASGQIVADSSSNETAGRNFAYQTTSQNIGSIAGLAAGAYLVQTAGFADMYLLLAGIVGIGAVLTFFVKAETRVASDRPFRFSFLLDPLTRECSRYSPFYSAHIFLRDKVLQQ